MNLDCEGPSSRRERGQIASGVRSNIKRARGKVIDDGSFGLYDFVRVEVG